MINLKKISAVLSVVILLVFSVVPVNAENVLSDVSEGKYIFDLDNSLAAEDEKYLSGELDRISKMTRLNIAVVITDDLGGKSSQSYADDFYDELFGINTDGILLLLDNQTQWDHISTSGKAIELFSDSYIDVMFEKITPYLKADDYCGAINRFFSLCDISKQRTSRTVKITLVGAVIALVVSGITCGAIAHGYKSHPKYSPRNYVADNETKFRVSNDTFRCQYTNKVKIETSSGTRNGGSSTHTSRSGGTHGGGSHHR